MVALDPRFNDENFGRNYQIVDAVKLIADRLGVTAAQLALAWVLAQGVDVVPIPGTRKVSRLEENLASLDITLTDHEIRSLNEAAPIGITMGDRYPDMSTVNV